MQIFHQWKSYQQDNYVGKNESLEQFLLAHSKSLWKDYHLNIHYSFPPSFSYKCQLGKLK